MNKQMYNAIKENMDIIANAIDDDTNQKVIIELKHYQTKSNWTIYKVVINNETFAICDKNPDNNKWLIKEAKTRIEKELKEIILYVANEEQQDLAKEDLTPKTMRAIDKFLEKTDTTEDITVNLILNNIIEQQTRAKRNSKELDALMKELGE